MALYKITFKGEFLPGQDPDKAMQRLIQLLKGGGKKKERILAGGPVTLKRSADENTVEKYRRAGKKCGVVFAIEPLPEAAPGVLEEPLVMAHEAPVTAEEVPMMPKPSDPPSREPGPADTAPRPVPIKRVACPACEFQQSASDTCINCGAPMAGAETGADSDAEPSGANPPQSRPELATKAPLHIPRPRKRFRMIRISLLLFILLIVSLSTWATRQRTTDWKQPLWVVVYPIVGDEEDDVAAHVESLDESEFEPITRFFVQETERYGLAFPEPFVFKLAPKVDELPPAPPRNRSTLNVMLWSLKLRYWAFCNNPYKGPSPDVRMFVVYHAATRELLEHSLGLQKGLIGVVHAYADANSSAKNNVIIAHEVLHTVGATDKYDPETGQPLFPHGYGDPDLEPRLPQELAEIMGSRIAKTEDRSVMPPSLDYTVIGSETAREIKWILGAEKRADEE